MQIQAILSDEPEMVVDEGARLDYPSLLEAYQNLVEQMSGLRSTVENEIKGKLDEERETLRKHALQEIEEAKAKLQNEAEAKLAQMRQQVTLLEADLANMSLRMEQSTNAKDAQIASLVHRNAKSPPEPTNDTQDQSMHSTPSGSVAGDIGGSPGPSTSFSTSAPGPAPPRPSPVTAPTSSGPSPAPASAATPSSGPSPTSAAPAATPSSGPSPTSPAPAATPTSPGISPATTSTSPGPSPVASKSPGKKRAWYIEASSAKAEYKKSCSAQDYRKILGLSRTVWLGVYNRMPADFQAYQPLSEAMHRQFMEGRHAGPDENLVLYLGEDHTGSPWNRKCVEILRGKAQKVIADKKLPAVPNAALESMFHDKLLTAGTTYNQYQTQYLEQEGRMETQEQATSRARKSLNTTAFMKRLRSSRERKFKSRRDAASGKVLELETSNSAQHLPSWNQHLRALDALGIDGQSDEETGVGELGGVAITVVNVYPTPWRAISATNSLRAIDAEVTRNKQGKRGAKPLHRMYPIGVEPPRPAPVRLKRALYASDFLAKLSPKDLVALEIDEEPFKLD
ncbi:hypothetical protein VNI00_018053 [Paramarasmius palmivorus]|uniref:Uncharacterized protein n=1 Tax=Paramarasmius palmivorus TaxID=297713 RepID=A0AAW0B0D7_9AGAR